MKLKSTGMTRPLDNLGRIVLPMELRRSMGIGVGDPLEVFIDSETGTMSFRKYVGVACKLCGTVEQLTYFRNHFICEGCVQEMKVAQEDQVVEVPAAVEENKQKRRNYKTDVLRSKLRDLMLQHPAFPQREYARILGVSQCRISQVKRELEKEAN